MDHIITRETVTIIDGPRVFIVSVSQPEYQGVLDALDAQDFDTVLRFADRSRPVREMSAQVDEVTVRNGHVYWRDEIMNGYTVRRIIEAAGDPVKFNTLVNFFARLKRNPSYRVVEGLLNWVEKGKMKITPEGKIIALKKVRADYTDAWTGTMDNSIGCRPRKDRNAIDDEPSKTCADSGLHFCSPGYLPMFQGYGSDDHIMVLEVDPEHVVSFPKNEESKGRACEYLVIDQVPYGMDPAAYIDSIGESFVATTTPTPAIQYPTGDDSIGYKVWNELDADIRSHILAELNEAEHELGTDGPNLPARLRAAERHLEIIVTDPDDWESRIDAIHEGTFPND